MFRKVKVKIYKIVILLVVLYGCETWSLTLREQHRPDAPKLCGAPGGVVGPQGDNARFLYEGHIYFEGDMGARQNIYFGRNFDWLTSLT
jgi:hypothetical protein